MTPEDIAHLLKYGGTCDAGVTRKGELEPCDKPAIAVAVSADEISAGRDYWWPVCPHHSRGRRMVKLPELIRAIQETR